MCGIVGAFGRETVVREIFEGLESLEYRGYDSAGISVISEGGELRTVKRVGKVKDLEKELLSLSGLIGIGHTRWATHGEPSERNAHPHAGSRIALVHNGVIENNQALRSELHSVEWRSETDTEVMLRTLEREVEWGGQHSPSRQPEHFMHALLRAGRRLEGRSAFAVLFLDDPKAIHALRRGSSLVIGRKPGGELMIASDVLAFRGRCSQVAFMPENSIARLTRTELEVWSLEGERILIEFVPLEAELASSELKGHRHFLHQEIHEQPRALRELLRQSLSEDRMQLQDSAGVAGLNLGKISHVQIIGCGSAFHAGLLGKKHLEVLTRLPVTIELASEARYSDQPLTPKTLLIALSQSGETADTLACAEKAVENGCQVLAFTNRKGSALSRIATKTIHLYCGPEMSVAATKTFTSMALALYLFALACGSNRGLLSKEALKLRLSEARMLPEKLEEALQGEGKIAAIAARHAQATSALFVGRRLSFPVAIEGALKLKEVSYIHAEGLAGGELKHGTLALVDRERPVFAIAPRDPQHAHHHLKMISNLQEIRARSGRIVGFGEAGDLEFRSQCEDYVEVPTLSEPLNPILSSVALQLLAYHVALLRGVDIDRPRNLAKSVTVE